MGVGQAKMQTQTYHGPTSAAGTEQGSRIRNATNHWDRWVHGGEGGRREEQVVLSGRWCSGSWFPQPEQLQLQPEPRPKPDIRVRTLGATNNCDRLHRVAGSAFYTLTKGIAIYIKDMTKYIGKCMRDELHKFKLDSSPPALKQ